MYVEDTCTQVLIQDPCICTYKSQQRGESVEFPTDSWCQFCLSKPGLLAVFLEVNTYGARKRLLRSVLAISYLDSRLIIHVYSSSVYILVGFNRSFEVSSTRYLFVKMARPPSIAGHLIETRLRSETSARWTLVASCRIDNQQPFHCNFKLRKHPRYQICSNLARFSTGDRTRP